MIVSVVTRAMCRMTAIPFGVAIEDLIKKYQNQALLDEINKAYEDQPDPSEQDRLAKMRNVQRKLVEGEW